VEYYEGKPAIRIPADVDINSKEFEHFYSRTVEELARSCWPDEYRSNWVILDDDDCDFEPNGCLTLDIDLEEWIPNDRDWGHFEKAVQAHLAKLPKNKEKEDRDDEDRWLSFPVPSNVAGTEELEVAMDDGVLQNIVDGYDLQANIYSHHKEEEDREMFVLEGVEEGQLEELTWLKLKHDILVALSELKV